MIIIVVISNRAKDWMTPNNTFKMNNSAHSPIARDTSSNEIRQITSLWFLNSDSIQFAFNQSAQQHTSTRSEFCWNVTIGGESLSTARTPLYCASYLGPCDSPTSQQSDVAMVRQSTVRRGYTPTRLDSDVSIVRHPTVRRCNNFRVRVRHCRITEG